MHRDLRLTGEQWRRHAAIAVRPSSVEGVVTGIRKSIDEL